MNGRAGEHAVWTTQADLAQPGAEEYKSEGSCGHTMTNLEESRILFRTFGVAARLLENTAIAR